MSVLVALKACNGKYVCMGDKELIDDKQSTIFVNEQPLIANKDDIQDCSIFEFDCDIYNTCTFKTINNLYIYVMASTLHLRTHEPSLPSYNVLLNKFEKININCNTFAFKSLYNNRYICADSEGNKPLIADKVHIGKWETFTIEIV